MTALPKFLEQARGLRRLSLHLAIYADGPLPAEGADEYYRYAEGFPAMGVWRNLAELSISGLAIGGRNLMKLLLGRARLRRLILSPIDLLDGTWEGVVEGMAPLPRLTELNMSCNLKHCGGAIFRPYRREGRFND